MGYQPLETPAIKHPPGNATFFCGKCNAPLAREDVHALSWEDKDFSCSECGTLFSHTLTCTELWGKFIQWCARLCLRLKYGMSVDDYYKQLVAGTRKSHSPLVFESPYIGKQNIGDRDMPYYPQGQSNTALLALMKSIEQEIEARRPVEPSPPMDYYPSMPDEDEWIIDEQQEAFELIPLNCDLLIKEE